MRATAPAGLQTLANDHLVVTCASAGRRATDESRSGSLGLQSNSASETWSSDLELCQPCGQMPVAIAALRTLRHELGRAGEEQRQARPADSHPAGATFTPAVQVDGPAQMSGLARDVPALIKTDSTASTSCPSAPSQRSDAPGPPARTAQGQQRPCCSHARPLFQCPAGRHLPSQILLRLLSWLALLPWVQWRRRAHPWGASEGRVPPAGVPRRGAGAA